MRARVSFAALAVAVATILIGSVAAQQAALSPVCADQPDEPPDGPPVLTPVDEAALRPDFLRFRRELQSIAKRRDEAALMRVVNPDIYLSFGDDHGIDEFRKLVREEARDSDPGFWPNFARVLDLGGSFFDRDRNTFVAPYVYSQWPNDYDALTCVAVTGRNVRLREQPRRDSRIVGSLNYAIVSGSPWASDGPWTRVGIAGGLEGYIATRYLYSPIGYRAFFSYRDGRWTMGTFIAGD